MNFNINKNDAILNQTYFVNKNDFESPIEIIDKFVEFSNSDSNYVSENSTIDLNNENEIDKSLIDFSELKSNSENWLFDDFYNKNNDFITDFNFKTMKINIKIDNQKSLLEKLLINLSFTDNIINKSRQNQFHPRMKMTTSTPICKKNPPFIKIDGRIRGSAETDSVDAFNDNKIRVFTNEDTFIKVPSSQKCLPNSLKCDLDSSFSDKTVKENFKSFKETSPIKNNDICNTTILYPTESKYFDTVSSDGGSEASLRDCPSLPLTNIVDKRRLTQPLVKPLIIVPHTFIKDKESNINKSYSLCDTKTISGGNSPSLSASSSENIIDKPTMSLKPQSRLSTLRQTFPKPSIVSSSTTDLPTRGVLQKSNFRKSVFESLPENKPNNRHSVMIRPKGTLSVQSELTRQSIAVFPSNLGQNKNLVSKIEKPTLSKFPLGMTVPLNSVTNDLTRPSTVPPNKTNQRIVAPSKIFKKSTLLHESRKIPEETSVSAESSIPQRKISRPSQLKYNNTTLKFPCHSDSVPLISPMSNVDDNPLSRTFDKQDFLLLKSVTNTNKNIVSSALDAHNNNTVYNIAQIEEQNLVKDLRPKSVAPSGLKLPSKIQSRAIPSLKR